MDVKTAFFNGELEKEVYMKQPEGFPSSDENVIDQCIYLKVSGSKVCFLFLYVNDILLTTNDKGLLHEVKQFLSNNFDMKEMGETSYVIGIKIQRDRFRGILGLSQEIYINKVLERFRIKDCSPSVSPIVKGDKFNLNQCPKNDLEREHIKNIPYVCTRPDIAFSVGMLGRCQSNPGLDHWRATKKVMRYFQGTKDYKLIIMDSISRPLSIYCDNSTIVFMAKNNKSGSQSKHIDIKYLAIRECVKEKKVVIEHIITELMIVDPLTKSMPPLKFKHHVMNMGLSSLM
ncbi:hypothetical protein AAG906_018057 [Vitis piasezkii]